LLFGLLCQGKTRTYVAPLIFSPTEPWICLCRHLFLCTSLSTSLSFRSFLSLARVEYSVAYDMTSAYSNQLVHSPSPSLVWLATKWTTVFTWPIPPHNYHRLSVSLRHLSDSLQRRLLLVHLIHGAWPASVSNRRWADSRHYMCRWRSASCFAAIEDT